MSDRPHAPLGAFTSEIEDLKAQLREAEAEYERLQEALRRIQNLSHNGKSIKETQVIPECSKVFGVGPCPHTLAEVALAGEPTGRETDAVDAKRSAGV